MAKILLSAASLSGLIAVVLGAFGAHALKGQISDSLLAVYQTGVHYQFVHTLALLAVGILMVQMRQTKAFVVSAVAFLIGILLFSGSLYALALGAPRSFGMITPVGGVSFIVGWMGLFLGVRQSPFFELTK